MEMAAIQSHPPPLSPRQVSKQDVSQMQIHFVKSKPILTLH